MKYIIIILLMFSMLSCADIAKPNYDAVLVQYDTARFKILNDSVAYHRYSGDYYRKSQSVGRGLRYYRLE